MSNTTRHIVCFYDPDLKDWDAAIEKALAAYPEEERLKIGVLCLPENYKRKPKRGIKTWNQLQ